MHNRFLLLFTSLIFLAVSRKIVVAPTTDVRRDSNWTAAENTDSAHTVKYDETTGLYSIYDRRPYDHQHPLG
jgi:hypothetical protein